jgi:hypothetical protein
MASQDGHYEGNGFIPVTPNKTYEDWGRLVMSWAERLEELPGDPFKDDSVTRFVFPDGKPKSIGGKTGATFPPTVQEVIFVRDTQTGRYVHLPDPVMVKAARKAIEAGKLYNLPIFYRDPPLNCQQPQGPAQNLKLQAERVGDYSIGSCM